MDIVKLGTIFLSVSTILAQIFIVCTVLCLFVPKFHKQTIISQYLNFLQTNAFKLAFVVTLSSALGSLFFSDVALLLPCELCWKQRVFIFPQLFIFAMAVWKREKVVADYSLFLSVIGLSYAIYHYIIQMFPSVESDCSLSGAFVSCTSKEIFEFGYVTIPMMSITAFSLLILLMILYKIKAKQIN